MTDPLSTDQLVVAFLLEDAPLERRVEARIWGGTSTPPKGAEYNPSDGGAICLQVVSGVDDYTDLLRHERVQFLCYDKSSAEADSLSRILHIALQNKRTGTIKWARRTLTPRVLTDPETRWVYAFVQYSIMVHQEE